MSTYDVNLISDLHKDAYGFRPTQSFWEEWNSAAEISKQCIWESLCEHVKEAIEREKLEEQLDLASFERDLARVMKAGDCDEATALGYMAPVNFDEATPSEQDIEHWVWEIGILYTERGKQVVEILKSVYNVR